MTQNIYQQLGLKQVINACGKMTILGVSSVAPEVMQATARAASSFVEIDQLVDKTGELVSRFTGAEDSYVTSCASAGIAIAVAAAITRGDKARVALMPDSSGMANEVVMLRGHNVDYGASILSAIRLGGGRVVEVGSSNLAALWQLESAITDATAALLYVKSHHCVQKGMLNIEDFAHVAQMYNLPLIVDAAAEEDLRAWVVSGADMVVYSGAKAFNAPTSGFITGKKIWIAACKAQHHCIARAMKIGKENMVGLVYALEEFFTTSLEYDLVWQRRAIGRGAPAYAGIRPYDSAQCRLQTQRHGQGGFWIADAGGVRIERIGVRCSLCVP